MQHWSNFILRNASNDWGKSCIATSLAIDIKPDKIRQGNFSLIYNVFVQPITNRLQHIFLSLYNCVFMS